MFAQGTKTAAHAVAGSAIFTGSKKAKVSGDERPQLRASQRFAHNFFIPSLHPAGKRVMISRIVTVTRHRNDGVVTARNSRLRDFCGRKKPRSRGMSRPRLSSGNFPFYPIVAPRWDARIDQMMVTMARIGDGDVATGHIVRFVGQSVPSSNGNHRRNYNRRRVRPTMKSFTRR